MAPANSTQPSGPQIRTWHVVGFTALVLLMLCAVGITGYFRLSSDTQALRESLMASGSGQWQKKISLRVGGVTAGLVRGGSRFFNVPPEARAALDSFHGGEIGIYRLQYGLSCADRSRMLAEAERTMRRRGWDRLVGVAQGQDLVAIYLPRTGVSAKRMKCCVMVLHDRELIVGSARGNLVPILQIAEKELHLGENLYYLAKR